MPSISPPSASKTSNGRFELPVLGPLDSLTAGTDIPPPPDSPIEEKSPAPVPQPKPENLSAVADGALSSGHGNGNGFNHGNSVTVSADGYNSRGRTGSNNTPVSPVSTTRPSSIRRFLSRKSLYNNYTNGTNNNNSQENLGAGGFRPDSPSGFSTATSKKRSSSWFRKFTSGGDPEPPTKRTSVVYEEKPRGPPAPTLPELDQLKSKVVDDEGSLGGDDMFKNIK